MSTIEQQYWDGVTAPAIPSGFNVSPTGGYSTIVTSSSGETPISSPNMLYLASGTVGTRTITWATPDGNSGNVSLVGTGLFATGTGNSEFSIFVRASLTTMDFTAGSAYEFKFSGAYGEFQINKYLSGTQTNLSNVSVGSFSTGVWYQITGSVNGSALQAQVQRLSDNYYLNMSTGAFQSGTSTMNTTDSSISGQGYSGWAGLSDTSAVYGDNWTLSTSASTPTQTPPRPVIVYFPREYYPAWSW